MILSPEVLRAATGCSRDASLLYADHLDAACTQYQISGRDRLGEFLPQVAHESAALLYARELASGEAYEGRHDLGNTEPGDGARYKGRGFLQCTGRANYRAMRDELRKVLGDLRVPDFEAFPEALERPEWACWSAAAWWASHGCNELADRGEYIQIGRLINRGNASSSKPANGEADRIARRERALRALAHLPSGLSDGPASVDTEDATPTEQEAEMPTVTPTMPAGEADAQPSSAAPSALGQVLTAAGAIAAKALAVANPLAGALVGVLAPLVQDKLARELGRHTDKPEVAQQVAGALVQAAQRATGQDDPVDAVSAARRSPQAVAAVEESVLETLEKLAPLLDRLEGWDRQRQIDEDASRDAAARRAAGDPHDQDEYLTRSIVQLMVGLLVGGAALAGVLAYLKVDVQSIVGALLLLAGGVGNEFKGRYAHRYGSTRGSAAKDVVIDQLARRK